jgi:hypothetical protein
MKFNIFLAVHLRIILVDNQLDSQFFYNIFLIKKKQDAGDTPKRLLTI